MSEVLEIAELLARIGDKRYHEFLRVPAMSAGIYVLQPGATDNQTPHKKDEIYYVVSGKAKLRLGSDERPVSEGNVIFVKSGLDHRFFDIAELVLLVIFAPAESS